jgi:hypothetical protein
MKIVENLGIEDMLKKYLTDTEAKELIAIAISKIIRPLHISSINTWFEGTSLSVNMNINLKSQRVSELLEKIG